MEEERFELTEKGKKLAEFNLYKEAYLKGLVGRIQGIYSWADVYLRKPAERDKRKAEVLSLLETVNDAFSQLPYEKFQDKPDFAPVFVTRDLVGKLNYDVNSLFDGEPEKYELTDLGRTAQAIGVVGGIFGKRFKQVYKELRSFPEYEDYSCTLRTITGGEWKMEGSI